MKNRVWYILSTFVIIVVGSFLHFTYELSNNNSFVAIFSAINESVWEHLKLLFWPSLFIATYEYFRVGFKIKGFFSAKAISLYVGIFLIVTIFYTYTGVIGKNFFFVDILTFIISVISSQMLSYYFTYKKNIKNKYVNYISPCLIFILVLLFVIFTKKPPKLPLFIEK